MMKTEENVCQNPTLMTQHPSRKQSWLHPSLSLGEMGKVCSIMGCI